MSGDQSRTHIPEGADNSHRLIRHSDSVHQSHGQTFEERSAYYDRFLTNISDLPIQQTDNSTNFDQLLNQLKDNPQSSKFLEERRKNSRSPEEHNLYNEAYNIAGKIQSKNPIMQKRGLDAYKELYENSEDANNKSILDKIKEAINNITAGDSLHSLPSNTIDKSPTLESRDNTGKVSSDQTKSTPWDKNDLNEFIIEYIKVKKISLLPDKFRYKLDSGLNDKDYKYILEGLSTAKNMKIISNQEKNNMRGLIYSKSDAGKQSYKYSYSNYKKTAKGRNARKSANRNYQKTPKGKIVHNKSQNKYQKTPRGGELRALNIAKETDTEILNNYGAEIFEKEDFNNSNSNSRTAFPDKTNPD